MSILAASAVFAGAPSATAQQPVDEVKCKLPADATGMATSAIDPALTRAAESVTATVSATNVPCTLWHGAHQGGTDTMSFTLPITLSNLRWYDIDRCHGHTSADAPLDVRVRWGTGDSTVDFEIAGAESQISKHKMGLTNDGARGGRGGLIQSGAYAGFDFYFEFTDRIRGNGACDSYPGGAVESLEIQLVDRRGQGEEPPDDSMTS